MSSAANHAKRSHRSEQMKGSTFRASARRAYYNQIPQTQRKNLFTRFFSKIINKIIKQKPNSKSEESI